MSWLQKYLSGHPKAYRWIRKARETTIPGFSGIPIYDVFTFFFKEIRKESLTDRAAAISFDFLLAFFPALLFLITLIPFIPVPDLETRLLLSIQNVVPYEAYRLIHESVTDIIMKERGGLLSIGFLLALYYSINGVTGIIHSFDKAYPTFKKRSFWAEKFAAFKLVLLLSFLTLASLILIIAGEQLIRLALDYLNIQRGITYIFFFLLKWTIIIFLLFNAFSLIYYFGPATHSKWRFFNTGSVLATVLSIIVSVGFSYFANNFGQYNKLFGSIGALIILMIWIYVNSLVLLIGFELNTSIDVNKNLKEPASVQ